MWCVKNVDSKKGNGLFATQDMKCETVILEEDPIASCQFSWNKVYKYRACDYCMKSLENAEEMSKRLTQNTSVKLPHPECCGSHHIPHVNCPNCEIQYCCTVCREKAYQEYHQVLCPVAGCVNHKALEQLDETWRGFHYPPETASIMLLVRLVARIKQEHNKEEFRAIIESFCHRSRNEVDRIAHKLLGDKFKVQLDILRDQFRSVIYDEFVAHWFTEEGFQILFALLGANQQGIGTSALSVWVHNCDTMELPQNERQELDNLIDLLYEELDKVAGTFLNCEGAGLYVTQSKCNHSCSPNAEVCFLHNNHRLTLRALRDISCGEEITISYLSECELSSSRHSRQKYLRENYLFICECEKCISQSGDPDVTSDEESDNSDNMME